MDRGQQAIQRAVDYVELHLGERVSVAAMAEAAHLSTYHFARLFKARTGLTPLGYVNRRRLSFAVAALRDSEQTISDIAARCGFASQQSFTHAFSERFAVAPAKYRSAPFVLHHEEPLNMSNRFQHVPKGPELRERGEFAIAGLTLRCNEHNKAQIPGLWQRFAPQMFSVPGCLPGETFGACYDMDPASGEFTYMAGIATQTPQACAEFAVCYVPPAKYAVFTHQGSLAHIQETVGYIYSEWASECEYELAATPDFELYDERFDPVKDTGELEYWVPVV